MTNVPKVPSTIAITHELSTVATDTKGSFRIIYSNSRSPEYPLTVLSTEEDSYESLCMSVADARDLAKRLITMVDAIEAIDTEFANLDAIVDSYNQGDFGSEVGKEEPMQG